MKNMDKRFAAGIFTIGVGIIALTGCGGDRKRDVVPSETFPVIELEGYRYDVIASLPDSLSIDVDGGKYVRVKGYGMLPVKIGGKSVPELRDSLERLGAVTILDRSQSEPRLDNGLVLTTHVTSRTKACGASGNQLAIALCTPQMIVWKDYSYDYQCRAAHGTYSTRFVNYSIAENKILALSDIFSKGYEKPLVELIHEKLAEEKVDLIVPMKEVDIPAVFEVTDTGIRFLYGIYDIAPYSSGEIEVELQSYELSDLFAPGVMNMLYGPEED